MADKPKKPQKLRARLPRGLADRGPAEIAATRRMTETIREVFERYGFEPVETPAMEFTDALGKFLPDQDRPNEGVFSFQDDDEQWISLRYDLTAPLARYVAENFDALPKPYRSFRVGYVYRNEKPGPGRFRQFMQFDADTVGSASPAADAEMCMMAADTMEALGIKPEQFVVKIWNRKCLDGVLEAAGASPDASLTVLRAVDKKDRVGLVGVQQLLDAGRWEHGEGKGDFTKGAGLSPSANNFITFSLVSSGVGYRPDVLIPAEELKKAEESPPQPFDFDEYRRQIISGLSGQPFPTPLETGLNELYEIDQIIKASGYADRVKIDKTVVRGLEYYTGPVYEVELTLETRDEKGRPVRFGSVGGGGRYDGLVSRFRGEPVPATGFSIGVSRLQAALEHLNKDKPQPAAFGPVVVTVFGGEIADYQKMVATLRNVGIRAELYLGNPKHSLGQQMKYADKRNAPCAIVQGSDERANGKIQIKDLILGAGLTEIKDREEYLKKQTEAQYEVDQDRLVEVVREVLARHGVKWG
jgi:histidyl-tRNA synthetase